MHRHSGAHLLRHHEGALLERVKDVAEIGPHAPQVVAAGSHRTLRQRHRDEDDAGVELRVQCRRGRDGGGPFALVRVPAAGPDGSRAEWVTMRSGASIRDPTEKTETHRKHCTCKSCSSEWKHNAGMVSVAAKDLVKGS